MTLAKSFIRLSFGILAFGSLTSCDHGTTAPKHEPEVYKTKPGPIQASEIPSKFLSFSNASSSSASGADLKSYDVLVMDGSTLTVAPVGQHQSLTLTASTIKLLNGARIVTNGNNLTLVAMTMEFNNSGGIDSFSAETAKAPIGTVGSDGGRVEIMATKGVSGSIRVTLSGQGGGDGSQGAKGSPGIRGPRGNDGVDGAFGCEHGGTNGGRGGDGGTGLPGTPGAAGGNGGDLVLEGEAIKDHANHFSFQAPFGVGGTGGAGGQGGDAGPGGEGGSGSKVYCGGGHGGDPGSPGAQGPQGTPGPSGKTAGKLIP